MKSSYNGFALNKHIYTFRHKSNLSVYTHGAFDHERNSYENEVMEVVLILALFLAIIHLYSKVGVLENIIRQTRVNTAQGELPPIVQAGQGIPMGVEIPQPQRNVPIAPQSISAVREESRFVHWLKEDWLIKVGAFLLFLGFVWFVSYAFTNWVPPNGRIAIGLVAGAVTMIFGWIRMGKFVRQGSIFLALGAAVVVLTTYAARSQYDMFTPAVALVVMFLSVLFCAVASYKARLEPLAWVSVVTAYVIPLLTVSHEVHELEFFTYLFLVTIGVLWLIFFTDWRRIFIAALTAVTLYSLPYWTMSYVNEGGLLIYGYVFVGIFFMSNLVGFLSLPKGRSPQVEVVGAIWNAIILSGWTHVGIGHDLQSLVYTIWAVVFLVCAYLFSVRVRKQEPFFVYAGIGVVFIGIATALQLDGPVLTIAFLIESTVLIILAQFLTNNPRFHSVTNATFAVPFALSLGSFAQFPTFPENLFTQDVAVVTLTTIALLVIGKVTSTRAKERDDGIGAAQVFFTLAGLFSFAFVWLFLHAIATEDTATQIALVLYIITGVSLYLTFQRAIASRERAFRLTGLLLVIFVIGHLLLVEVWNMEIIPRIVTFFVIGAGLMSTAFLKKHHT